MRESKKHSPPSTQASFLFFSFSFPFHICLLLHHLIQRMRTLYQAYSITLWKWKLNQSNTLNLAILLWWTCQSGIVLMTTTSNSLNRRFRNFNPLMVHGKFKVVENKISCRWSFAQGLQARSLGLQSKLYFPRKTLFQLFYLGINIHL